MTIEEAIEGKLLRLFTELVEGVDNSVLYKMQEILTHEIEVSERCIEEESEVRK